MQTAASLLLAASFGDVRADSVTIQRGASPLVGKSGKVKKGRKRFRRTTAPNTAMGLPGCPNLT